MASSDDRSNQLTSQQQVVVSHQTELARCAYLLTGNLTAANQLATDTLLSFFDQFDASLDFDQRRPLLFTCLAHHFLHPDSAQSEPTSAAPQTQPVQRLPVDDERTKLLDLLKRLTPNDRLAIVLRDYVNIDEENIARTLTIPPYQLAERLIAIRHRLREIASADDGVSTRSLLAKAASTTPRLQIWSLVSEPLAARERERRRRARRLTWLTTAGVAMLLLIGGIWVIAGSDWLTEDSEDEAMAETPGTSTAVSTEATSPTTPTARPTATSSIATLDIPQGRVTSMMRISPYPNQTSDEPHDEVFSYDPLSHKLTQLSQDLQGVEHRLISPDGRWILGQDWGERGGPLQRILMIDAETREVVWTKEIGESRQFQSFAFAGDYLYALQPEQSAYLAVFDIQTGEEQEGRDEMLEELGAHVTRSEGRRAEIFATPDSSKLWLYLVRDLSLGNDRGPTYFVWSLSSYSLPDLTLRSHNQLMTAVEGDQIPDRYQIYDPIWTPDGTHLVTIYRNGGSLLFSSPIPEQQMGLNLPFAPAAESGPQDLVLVPSNTGRLLYIIATARREVAIVDLLTRSVLRVAPIDPGEFTIEPVLDTRGHPVAETAFSPDGSLLYVANAWTSTGKLSGSDHLNPVTVIDTTLWKVVQQLDVYGRVWGLFPIAGGERIAVYHQAPPDEEDNAASPNMLSIFDTKTGALVYPWDDAPELFDLPEWAAGFGLTTPYTSYRQRYARSPAMDGVEFRDSETISSRPRVQMASEAEIIPAGVPFEIEVRVSDPVTGDLLTSEHDGVRYDPQSIASVALRPTGEQAKGVLVVLSYGSDGVYRGTATVQTGGIWDAKVTFIDPAGRIWSATLGRALATTATVQGDDGRGYIVVNETEPDDPTTDTPVVFTARFVDAISHETIPADVKLQEGLPEIVDILITSPEGGFNTVHLYPVDHGIYQGEGQFRGAGRWAIQVRFQYSNSRGYVYLQAGVVTVGFR